MRRTISIITLLLTVAFSMQAQVEEPRRLLELGVSGGINMNSLDLQPTMRQKMLNGVNGGIINGNLQNLRTGNEVGKRMPG